MSKPGKAKKRLEQDQQEPSEPKELFKKGTPQDVASVRAKNSGHGKVTADKWNQ